VTLPVDDLLEALKTAVYPAHRKSCSGALRIFVKKQMRGYDAGTTRLTLDR